MEILENYVYKWIILVLGKSNQLSGKQIYEEAKKEKECSKLALPTSLSSYYEYLGELEKEDFVRQVAEKRIRGTVAKFYSLTQKGKDAFPEIQDTFVIDEMIPAFIDSKRACSECNPTKIEQCWSIYAKDLEVILRDMQDIFPKSRLRPLSEVKQEFETPYNLREFIFWLQMLKVPKKRLNKKYATQMKQLGLEIT